MNFLFNIPFAGEKIKAAFTAFTYPLLFH